jgi:hypothetical protein
MYRSADSPFLIAHCSLEYDIHSDLKGVKLCADGGILLPVLVFNISGGEYVVSLLPETVEQSTDLPGLVFFT